MENPTPRLTSAPKDPTWTCNCGALAVEILKRRSRLGPTVRYLRVSVGGVIATVNDGTFTCHTCNETFKWTMDTGIVPEFVSQHFKRRSDLEKMILAAQHLMTR